MRRFTVAAALLALSAGLLAGPVSADPVVRYLEGKGVLTPAEAEALRLEIGEARKDSAPAQLLTLGNRLRIDGRIYAGYLDREGRGSTFEIPDGALRFTWGVADDIDIVTRWRYGNAQSNNLDQMFVRFRKLFPFDPTSSLSLGKFKMDVGEEHKSDNRVGNWPGLITNSAGAVAATDWGLELAGSLVPKKAGYVLTLSNANAGDAVDNNYKKAWSAKAHFRPVDMLYLSAGYYTSDSLDDSRTPGVVDNSALGIAGNRNTLPGAVTDWKRSAWKMVARLTPVKGTRIGASYGQFTDAALAPAGINDRKGDMFYVEVRQDLSPEFYLAARYSSVGLKDNATATLNGLAGCNSYDRVSFGAGWQVARRVTVKAEYTNNTGKRPGSTSLSADQFALGVAATF